MLQTCVFINIMMNVSDKLRIHVILLLIYFFHSMHQSQNVFVLQTFFSTNHTTPFIIKHYIVVYLILGHSPNLTLHPMRQTW